MRKKRSAVKKVRIGSKKVKRYVRGQRQVDGSRATIISFMCNRTR